MRLKTLLIIMCFTISMIPIFIIGGLEGFQSTIYLIVLIAFVTFSVSMIIAYLITRPIENLTKKIDSISRGQLDVKLEKSEIYEINNLTNSLNRVMVSLKLAVHKVGVKKGEIFDNAVKTKEIFEKKQMDLLDSIAGWAWETDAAGVYTFFSTNVSKFLGYNPDELIGKKVADITPEENTKKIKNEFEQASKKNKAIENLENYYIKKNGENVFVLTNGVPFYNDEGVLLGFRGVDVDISRQKIAEDKIKDLNKQVSDLQMEIKNILDEKQNQVYKKINKTDFKDEKIMGKFSENKMDSVYFFDENANVIDCNENMYKKLGYSKKEMLSLNVIDFDALESKEEIAKKINKAKKEGYASFKTIHKKKDGSAVLVNENIQYIKDKNTFKCIVQEDLPLK